MQHCCEKDEINVAKKKKKKKSQQFNRLKKKKVTKISD